MKNVRMAVLLLVVFALPAAAEEMHPGTQVWTRTQGNVERRLTIVAKSHDSGCCALGGHMEVFENGKLIHDREIAREQFAAWPDGVPVSITIISDTAGTPDGTLNVMLLDKDTMVLYEPWFPNRNKIYKRSSSGKFLSPQN